jgi:hypothetical protein
MANPKFYPTITSGQEGDTLFYRSGTWVNGPRIVSEARTATAAPGGTTGVVSAGTNFVTVTSDDANKVITLPTPTPGTTIALANGATGYELRSSDPATVAINGGSGANAESAIPANTLTVCTCKTATTWLCSNTSTNGTSTPTEVAAP